jgi:hypothetical protein
MGSESLRELKVAFAAWRRGKRHVREAVPDELLARAGRAVEVHGVKEVVRAIGVERSRLFRRRRDEVPAAKRPTPAAPVLPALPAYTRLELTPPVVGAQPIAELETPSGLKLRVFAESHAMVGLLSSLCGVGGAG